MSSSAALGDRLQVCFGSCDQLAEAADRLRPAQAIERIFDRQHGGRMIVSPLKMPSINSFPFARRKIFGRGRPGL